MPFCANCGNNVDGVKFCAGCGTAVGHAGTAVPGGVTSYTKEELTGTADAVRDFSAGEPEGKTYGKQKWGLFETNYQRNKGISTDESLREIEDFATKGIAPRSGASGEVAGGSGGDSRAGGSAGGSGGFGGGSAGRAGGGFGAGGAGGGRTGAGAPGGEAWHSGGAAGRAAKDFNERGPGGGAGASFFAQHQAKESSKYRPGRGF